MNMAYLKADLHTDNPKKLYRKIYDVCEDEISERGYHLEHRNSYRPLLKENALYNVADFDGKITIVRDIFALNLISLIAGLIAVGVGSFLLIYPDIFSLMIPNQWIGIIAIIAGIIVIFIKSRSSLVIQIYMEGEGYRTKKIAKGKSNDNQDSSFEQLNVESDVRLTVTGWLKEDNSIGGSPTANMKRDLQTLTKKITELIEPYMVKNRN